LAPVLLVAEQLQLRKAPPDDGLSGGPTAGAGLPALAWRPRALARPVGGAVGARPLLRVILFIGAQVCQVALHLADAARISPQSDTAWKRRAGLPTTPGGLGAPQQHGRRLAQCVRRCPARREMHWRGAAMLGACHAAYTSMIIFAHGPVHATRLDVTQPCHSRRLRGRSGRRTASAASQGGHLIVALQQLQRAAAVPGAAELRVHRDAHDAAAAERGEVCVLELLPDRPWDQVALPRP